MPDDYNFDHKGFFYYLLFITNIGVDWSKYQKDFTLRTDAVWEK